MWFAEEPKVKIIHESELGQVKVARSTRGRGRGKGDAAWLTDEEIKSCRAKVFQRAMKFYRLATLLALHSERRRRRIARRW